jgi:hypothetical protein
MSARVAAVFFCQSHRAVSLEAPNKRHKSDEGYYKLLYSSRYSLLDTAPSTFGTPSSICSVMEPEAVGSEGFMFNRPIDFGMVPLALLSPIFVQSEDDFYHYSDFELGLKEFAPTRELTHSMSNYSLMKRLVGISSMTGLRPLGQEEQQKYLVVQWPC